MKSNKGISSLVTVLFGMVVVSAMMLSIFMYTSVLNRQATRSNTSEAAFYAAESALFETMERIKNYPPFDAAAYAQPYTLGMCDIERNVTYDGSAYTIGITARLRGMERKMEGTYKPGVAYTYDEVLP